jgi:hypothetical protein
MLAPAQTYASLAALAEGAARAELRAPPACRLHARVRQQAARTSPVSAHEALDVVQRVLRAAPDFRILSELTQPGFDPVKV